MAEDIKQDEVLQEDEIQEVEAEVKPEKKKKHKLSKEAEELQQIKAEFEIYKESHLRVLAEYDNFRKRSITEKAQIYANAVADAVGSILPVADNIDRALALEAGTVEDMKKGIELVSDQFTGCFEKLGITVIGKVAEPFDPLFHNAVAHIDSEEFGENTVSAIFQKGYKLGDKVIRHAMVQVAN